MKFCKYCDNILKLKFDDNNILVNYCNICELEYKLEPKDTLLKSIHVNVTDNIYKTQKNLIERFKKDNILQKIEKKCPNCNHNISKQAIIGKNMDFVFICDNSDCLYVSN